MAPQTLASSLDRLGNRPIIIPILLIVFLSTILLRYTDTYINSMENDIVIVEKRQKQDDERDQYGNDGILLEGETTLTSSSQFAQEMPMITKETFTIDKKLRQYDSQICNLFNFAVTGFAKCGTTSIRSWLYEHESIRMPQNEQNTFYKNPLRTAKFIQTLTNETGQGEIRGYENPHDIQWPTALSFYANTCPETKLIVLIRHPVLWFQSYYNYRIAKGETWSINGEPNDLIVYGNAAESGHKVKSNSGAFHKYLAVLGKTNLDDDELNLLDGFYDDISEFRQGEMSIKNPVFLLETSQLESDKESSILNRDIQQYLGLSNPLNAKVPHSKKAKRKNKKPKKMKKMMNICDAQYKPIHDEMLRIARNASTWIRNYFLLSPDVKYSESLPGILESWNIDPCESSKA